MLRVIVHILPIKYKNLTVEFYEYKVLCKIIVLIFIRLKPNYRGFLFLFLFISEVAAYIFIPIYDDAKFCKLFSLDKKKWYRKTVSFLDYETIVLYELNNHITEKYKKQALRGEGYSELFVPKV